MDYDVKIGKKSHPAGKPELKRHKVEELKQLIRDRPTHASPVILLCFFFIIFIFYDSYEGGRLFGDLMAFATAFLVGASTVIIRYAKKYRRDQYIGE